MQVDGGCFRNSLRWSVASLDNKSFAANAYGGERLRHAWGVKVAVGGSLLYVAMRWERAHAE